MFHYGASFVFLVMYFVYVLKSINHDRFYIGMSQDVNIRLGQHNGGKTSSTKFYAPWVIFFFEDHETRALARVREKYLKTGVGREFIRRKWENLNEI